MSFQSPWLLLGLLAIPLLVGFYITSQRRRRAYAVRFTNLALLNQVMGKGPGFRRHLPAILFVAGVAGLLLSMARPQASIRVPKGQTSVMLAVDVSGSMAATDVQPTRIEAAIAAGRTLIDKLPSNASGGGHAANHR
ncbi:MAG: VWA domain-containing protein [Chloroflexi bacterium]|nr:MAG: VWA domain-containing protein [Chloroflexota bacterium]